MKTYIYAAAFEPGFIKVGRSRTPHARLRLLKCTPGVAPSNVVLKTGKLLSATIETKKLTEPQVHKQLHAHLHSRCREWFRDSEEVLAILASLGFSQPPASDPENKSGVRVGAAIPADEHRRLKMLSASTGVKQGDIIRFAVQQYAERAERKAK